MLRILTKDNALMQCTANSGLLSTVAVLKQWQQVEYTIYLMLGFPLFYIVTDFVECYNVVVLSIITKWPQNFPINCCPCSAVKFDSTNRNWEFRHNGRSTASWWRNNWLAFLKCYSLESWKTNQFSNTVHRVL